MQMCWRHIIVNTKSTWLHGDPRGFRNRDHRIHSSGDYKNPPPPTEHAGLFNWMNERAGPPEFMEDSWLPLILDAYKARLTKEGFCVVAISAGKAHAHSLTLLPDEPSTVKLIVGRCKRNMCEAIKKFHTGPLWAGGGEYKRVTTLSHFVNVINYIAKQDKSFVWADEDARRDPVRRFAPDPA